MEALGKKFLAFGRKIKVQAMRDKISDVIRIGIRYFLWKGWQVKISDDTFIWKVWKYLVIGFYDTVEDGWFNAKEFVTLVKDKLKSYEPLTRQIPSWE